MRRLHFIFTLNTSSCVRNQRWCWLIIINVERKSFFFLLFFIFPHFFFPYHFILSSYNMWQPPSDLHIHMHRKRTNNSSKHVYPGLMPFLLETTQKELNLCPHALILFLCDTFCYYYYQIYFLFYKILWTILAYFVRTHKNIEEMIHVSVKWKNGIQ